MALNVSKFKVTLRLTTDMLGTVPKNRSVYSTFIAQKAKELLEKEAEKGIPLTDGTPSTPEGIDERVAEEVVTVGELEEKGWTGFHQDEKGPFLYDYLLKGFLKTAAGVLKTYELDEDEQAEVAAQSATKKKKPDDSLKQLASKITNYVFVLPRRVYLTEEGQTNGELKNLERPLRAMTAQGPRVTVVRSDLIPEGAQITFTLHVVRGGGITEGLLQDLLEYGMYQGLGQWRSGGYGRFEVVEFSKLK